MPVLLALCCLVLMRRYFNDFTWLEALIWLVIALVVSSLILRVFFPAEIRVFEYSFFESIGLRGNLKYLVLIPLSAWIYWRFFTREASIAKERGVPIISKGTIIFSLCALFLIIGLLVIYV